MFMYKSKYTQNGGGHDGRLQPSIVLVALRVYMRETRGLIVGGGRNIGQHRLRRQQGRTGGAGRSSVKFLGPLGCMSIFQGNVHQ
jgi:hypothetical protein